MFQRGTVVQHNEHKRIGVVLWDQCDSCDRVSATWFDLYNGLDNPLATDLTVVSDQAIYAFEAAIALHDTAKVLEMYHALQSALTPFARFGQLQRRYAPDALFTIAYDRTGKEVVIRYADLVHAAELVPNTEMAGQGGAQIGGRGGIAEIMNESAAYGEYLDEARRKRDHLLFSGAKFTYRVRWTRRSDGESFIGQVSANSEDEAVNAYLSRVINAVSAEVIETTPYGVPFASEGIKP